MINPKQKSTQSVNQLVNDQLNNQADTQQKQQLVHKQQQVRAKKNIQFNSGTVNIKLDNQPILKAKLEQAKQNNKSKTFNMLILLLAITIFLVVSIVIFKKYIVRYITSQPMENKIQIHGQVGQQKEQHIQRCFKDDSIFSVYYNESDKQMKYYNQSLKTKSNNRCQLTLLGYYDLQQMKQQWNNIQPNYKIDLSTIKQENKQILVILLRLYLAGGTYINTTISYSNVSNRVLKYTLLGVQPLYIDYSQVNNRGFRIPDIKKFIKVRLPYSPVIQRMITRIIKNQDYLWDCKNKQCLIVK